MYKRCKHSIKFAREFNIWSTKKLNCYSKEKWRCLIPDRSTSIIFGLAIFYSRKQKSNIEKIEMEKFRQQMEKDILADDKPWSKYLKVAEEKTGVSRQNIFLGEKKSIFIILHCCVVYSKQLWTVERWFSKNPQIGF